METSPQIISTVGINVNAVPTVIVDGVHVSTVSPTVIISPVTVTVDGAGPVNDRDDERDIDISFLPVGHTKFSPDWCFGLLKQKFRRSEVNCLDDLVRVVTTSASSNTAQLVGTQSGDVIVPTYNWSEHFGSHMKKIPNITTYHHFLFSSDKPGVITVKEHIGSPELSINIKKKEWSITSDIPSVVTPLGLPIERQVYLFEKIRPFCSPQTQDLVCPNPSTTTTSTTTSTTSTNINTTNTSTNTNTGKKQRLCSKCQQPGHNVRSCKT